jgi:hypothetical protein
MNLTSDPHAWLRPYYIALKNDGAFWMLAEPLRFEALCCAVEPEHPSRAASMREWSSAAQQGILGWLETVMKEKPAVREVELWRVAKDTRELRGVVRLHAPRPGSAADAGQRLPPDRTAEGCAERGDSSRGMAEGTGRARLAVVGYFE